MIKNFTVNVDSSSVGNTLGENLIKQGAELLFRTELTMMVRSPSMDVVLIKDQTFREKDVTVRIVNLAARWEYSLRVLDQGDKTLIQYDGPVEGLSEATDALLVGLQLIETR